MPYQWLYDGTLLKHSYLCIRLKAVSIQTMSGNRLRSLGLKGSMSHHDNCHDKAVGESFYPLLICEQVKEKITEHGKKPAAMAFHCLPTGTK